MLSGTNGYLRWFSIVVWVGVLPNLYFAFPALFVPSYIVDTLGLQSGFETVWLRNAGLLIFIITSYHILAALMPARYPIVGWLVIGGRLVAAVYWLIVILDVWGASSAPESFVPFLVGDLVFGAACAALLYLGLRKEAAVAPAGG